MLLSRPDSTRRRRALAALARPCALVFVVIAAASARAQEDPAEVAIGERLFLETRFAEFFARHAVDINTPLATGDPVVDTTRTTQTDLPGPFAGESMNCRACHLVDEHRDAPGGGIRTYADFARRSPIPARSDGRQTAPRNSPSLVNASLARRGGIILHLDGEFASLESLVRGTLTGRNYGWLAGEQAAAVAHIARVVREDDGSGALATELGGAYRDVLAGDAEQVPAELLLPEALRIDVDQAGDDAVVDAVARLVAIYVEQLVFAQDEEGRFNGSPYDAFLRANRLPLAPRTRETPAAYTARLRKALRRLHTVQYVDDGPFVTHPGRRVFGSQELRGLLIFLEPAPRRSRASDLARGGVGNCAACHFAPAFTDFGFHNTGVSQVEYDALHGPGSFATLAIPDLATRNADPNAWLPASPQHPNALEPFRAPADVGDPRRADLGIWNIVGNPDVPAVQAKLQGTLCRQAIERGDRAVVASAHGSAIPGVPCRPGILLERSIARFKTPGLRDLAHSAPYLHDGSLESLEDVVDFYRAVSEEARSGGVRNGAPELSGIALVDADVAALAAFLRALDEDYE